MRNNNNNLTETCIKNALSAIRSLWFCGLSEYTGAPVPRHMATTLVHWYIQAQLEQITVVESRCMPMEIRKLLIPLTQIGQDCVQMQIQYFPPEDDTMELEPQNPDTYRMDNDKQMLLRRHMHKINATASTFWALIYECEASNRLNTFRPEPIPETVQYPLHMAHRSCLTLCANVYLLAGILRENKYCNVNEFCTGHLEPLQNLRRELTRLNFYINQE